MMGGGGVSSNQVVSSFSSECRANIYEATGGMAGQMERREYVSLIDVVGAEAGSGGGGEGGREGGGS